jgi:nucleoside triphosphate pyrophosphatase
MLWTGSTMSDLIAAALRYSFMPLILASGSPRRAELLTAAGIPFEAQPADIDETPLANERPDAYVLRIARSKAQSVAARCRKTGATVLAADTVVVAKGQLLPKPAGRRDAARMLELLSGAVHEVFTGVVVTAGTRELSETVCTRVHVVPLGADEIEWYVATGEPEGKAGAYAIQGRAARFIDRIEGSYSNVVGLPVATVYRMLKELDRVALS